MAYLVVFLSSYLLPPPPSPAPGFAGANLRMAIRIFCNPKTVHDIYVVFPYCIYHLCLFHHEHRIIDFMELQYFLRYYVD